MTGFIPEEKIERIRRSVDIVDIVSESVLLRKSGKNYTGLCPFHSEKTPSFTVSPDKQIFHCFGCGSGGDAFGFLMKQEGVSFPEAVRFLGRKCGIEIQESELTFEQKKRIQDLEEIRDIHRLAAEFFQRLLQESPAAESARAYLKRRGFDEELTRSFGLGYAPPGWDGLSNYLSNRRFSLENLEKSGLVVRRKSGAGFYDRFRNRIMFPITDPRGMIAAFGGRVMDDSVPKYLNSPETPIFSKKNCLYGLYEARRARRENDVVYIVEGYFDVLGLRRCGIQNVVATLGTALSAEHMRLVKGCADRAILMYDSDPAGVRAALKSIDLFQKAFVEARILVLTEGEDPDSFIFKYGKEAFLRAVEKSQSMMGFLMESAIRTHGLSIEGKARVVKDLQKPLESVEDPVARSLYVKELAQRIGVAESLVQGRIRGHVPAAPQNAVSGPSPVGRHRRMEKKIVAMMIQYPDIIKEIQARNLIGDFEDPVLQSLGMCLQEHASSLHAGVSAVLGALKNEEERRLALELAMQPETWSMGACERLIGQYLSGRNGNHQELIEKIEIARRRNDQALLVQLLAEKQDQARKRRMTT